MSMFRNIIMSKGGRLPAGYQEVEYIEGTGTQYIKTNIIGKPTTDFELDFELTTLVNRYQMYIAPEGSPRSCPKLFADYSTITNIRVQGSTSYTIQDVSKEVKHKLAFIGTNMYLDDVVVKNNINKGSQNNTKGYWIFNAVDEPTLIACMKLYELIFWDNSVEVNHLVPCYRKSDNEIGLYDIIENVFYTNQGTGTFLKGGNV